MICERNKRGSGIRYISKSCVLVITIIATFQYCFATYVKPIGDLNVKGDIIKRTEKFEVNFEAELTPMASYNELKIKHPNLAASQLEAKNKIFGVVKNEILSIDGISENQKSDFKIRIGLKLLDPNVEGGSSLAWSVLPFLLTAFIFPMVSTHEEKFQIDVIYKNEVIKKYEYGFREISFFTWLALPFNIFVSSWSDSWAMYLDSINFHTVLQPLTEKIKEDVGNDFNADEKDIAKTEFYRVKIREISGSVVTVNFSAKEKLRPGLNLDFLNSKNEAIGKGKVSQLSFTNAKIKVLSGSPKKGDFAVGYKSGK